MKIQYLEDGERVFPTLGITVNKNDFYEIPDEAKLVKKDAVSSTPLETIKESE
jgi:hypothetical protein